jgi:inosine/xanthosine triphosphate pyrophosphatase family protein
MVEMEEIEKIEKIKIERILSQDSTPSVTYLGGRPKVYSNSLTGYFYG